jgi:hypothetical protein
MNQRSQMRLHLRSLPNVIGIIGESAVVMGIEVELRGMVT